VVVLLFIQTPDLQLSATSHGYFHASQQYMHKSITSQTALIYKCN